MTDACKTVNWKIPGILYVSGIVYYPSENTAIHVHVGHIQQVLFDIIPKTLKA